MKRIPRHLDLPRPYLVFNHHYAMIHPVWKSWRTRVIEIYRESVGIDRWASSPNIPETVSEEGLKSSKFYKNAIIIDRQCRRYNVIGYELLGQFRNFWNLWGLVGSRRYYYRLLVDEPTQVTFDAARFEIVEHCVNRRWSNQTGATPKQFREHHIKKVIIDDVMKDVGFLGRDPF
jgi:hypothetical protein